MVPGETGERKRILSLLPSPCVVRERHNFYFCRNSFEGGENEMPLRLKALMLVTTLSSLAVFLADWGWGP
jgi:hypothetical protein